MNNFELIETVRVRKPLWDKSTWEKVDVVTREVLWNEVATKMSTSKEIVRTRWKNLRDSYRKIIRKMESTDTASPKWPYFKAMEFLKEITLNTKPRNTDISLNKIEVQLEADYSLTLLPPSENEDSIDPLSFSGRVNHQQESQYHQISTSSVKQEGKGTKRSADEDNSMKFLELESDNCENTVGSVSKPFTTETPSKTSIADDDDYQFLLSLYPHLKQVSNNRKLVLRMKIEHLIYNEIYTQNPNRSTQTDIDRR